MPVGGLPPKRRDGAAYPLAEVRRLARFAAVGRRVVQRTREAYPLSEPEVEAFIRRTIAALKDEDFAEVVAQDYGDLTIDADVYGVRNKEGAWYVKFYVQHGRVVVLSCHTPEFPITCANGRTICG